MNPMPCDWRIVGVIDGFPIEIKLDRVHALVAMYMMGRIVGQDELIARLDTTMNIDEALGRMRRITESIRPMMDGDWRVEC